VAKTIYPHDFYGMHYGYAVNTTVLSSQTLFNNAVPPQAIGAIVTPASISGIAENQLLEIGGVQVTVSEVNGGSFKYSLVYLPAPGTSIRTPWLAVAGLRYTQAANNFAFAYYAPALHDLYLGTFKTPDSGSVSVILDGNSLGAFDLSNPTNALLAVLLAEDVQPGEHSLTVTAAFDDPDEHFVYFQKIELLEHIPQTGGFYSHLGPDGSLVDSTNNFLGDWSTSGEYAFTSTPGSSVFFYPQLDTDGAIKIRVQKTPDSGIISVLQNGTEVDQIDLYASPGLNPTDIVLLTQPPANAASYEIELRLTVDSNPNSSGSLFYFRGSVVMFSRTDEQALTLTAKYLVHVASQSGDGSFSDAHDSSRINFDATSLYACMGLLAAYQIDDDPDYLLAVRDFLIWFAQQQMQSPSDSFTDGAWNIGYQRINGQTPTYIPAIAPYDAQGISEIRWVDAVQCLPAFILYWYAALSGDNAVKAQLLPTFAKGIDGFIRNNYDSGSGFFYSSWQLKTSPTIFLYHDAIQRYSSSNVLLEQHDDSETDFFTYNPPSWGSYAPEGAIGSNEHFSLEANSYAAFFLSLDAGDQLRWITQTAWDVGIAEVLVSTDGTAFTPAGTFDCYSSTSQFQESFVIYTAASAGTYWFRIRHSGTINQAGMTNLGWQRLPARYAAGQTDVALGLLALWEMTRKPRYATLAARLMRRFDGRFWSDAGNRWAVALEGSTPGTPNYAWYPFPHGYTAFGQGHYRLFQPKAHLLAALDSLTDFQDDEGGIHPPGFLEAEHIFSAFYVMGMNLQSDPNLNAAYEIAKTFVKGGQYFLQLGGELVAGLVFSKRYPYLYCNIAGFACLALAGAIDPEAARSPLIEQPSTGRSELWLQPS